MSRIVYEVGKMLFMQRHMKRKEAVATVRRMRMSEQGQHLVSENAAANPGCDPIGRSPDR